MHPQFKINKKFRALFLSALMTVTLMPADGRDQVSHIPPFMKASAEESSGANENNLGAGRGKWENIHWKNKKKHKRWKHKHKHGDHGKHQGWEHKGKHWDRGRHEGWDHQDNWKSGRKEGWKKGQEKFDGWEVFPKLWD